MRSAMVSLDSWNSIDRDAADDLFEALASRRMRQDVSVVDASGTVDRPRPATDLDRRLVHGLFRYPLGRHSAGRRARW
jgi:hypothetical protein